MNLTLPDTLHSSGNTGAKALSSSRVRVSLENRIPGIVELPQSSEHLVRVHASRLLGACAQDRFRYIPGDIDILPAGVAEQWEEFTPSRSVIVCLPEAILHDAADQAGLSTRMNGLEARFQIRDLQIEHIAWALNAEREAGNPNGPIYSEFLAMALAIHLLVGYRSPPRVSDGLAKHKLRKVQEYIEDNLDKDLTVAHLAALSGLSISHFGVQFKKSAGIPVHEYVIRRRVEHAKRLLQESELSISQIALDVGFTHQSHLARWMRRVLGLRPNDLRYPSARQ